MVLAFGPDGKTLASGGWDTTVTLWDVKDLAKKAVRPEPLSRDRLAALFSDLDGADGTKPTRRYGRGPRPRPGDAAVPRAPCPAVPPGERVAKLIAQLDDDDFDVREAASAELEKIGRPSPRCAGAGGKPSPEAKRRIEALLAKSRRRPRRRIAWPRCGRWRCGSWPARRRPAASSSHSPKGRRARRPPPRRARRWNGWGRDERRGVRAAYAAQRSKRRLTAAYFAALRGGPDIPSPGGPCADRRLTAASSLGGHLFFTGRPGLWSPRLLVVVDSAGLDVADRQRVGVQAIGRTANGWSRTWAWVSPLSSPPSPSGMSRPVMKP